MTDQFTSLSPAAIREIIGKLDEGLAQFENRPLLPDSETKIRQMMKDLRDTLDEKLRGMRDLK